MSVRGRACSAVWDRLVEAATGEVRPEVRRQLDAHLARCPRCRAEWDALQEVVAWLREVPEPSVPVGFWEELDRRVTQPGAGRRKVRPLAGVALLVAGALAVVRWAPWHRPVEEEEVVGPAVVALMPEVAELVRRWEQGLEVEVGP